MRNAKFKIILYFLPRIRRFTTIIGNVLFSLLRGVKFEESNELTLVSYRGFKFYVRCHYSDISRVNELYSGVNRLKDILLKFKVNVEPTALIDFGSNIGTSVISILSEYNLIRSVICFEANFDNFKILEKK
ncbi:hypothetical protein OAS37_02295 [Alphaproteobacteria bacterium]|nr:hypothetical protein [Alphaproteobacteria bacterium]